MKAFVAAAVAGVAGVAVALPWENIVSERTAGVLVVAIAGLAATLKALFADPPATKAK